MVGTGREGVAARALTTRRWRAEGACSLFWVGTKGPGHPWALAVAEPRPSWLRAVAPDLAPHHMGIPKAWGANFLRDRAPRGSSDCPQLSLGKQRLDQWSLGPEGEEGSERERARSEEN